jgi:hypothetical protein
MRRASSVWHPAASIVAIAPDRPNARSGSGIAPTSFDPSGTPAWPRTRRFSVAQAVTTWAHPAAVFRLAARADSPSVAACQAGRLARRRHPSAERSGERPRGQLGEHPGERVGTRDAVGRLQEPAEERRLGPPVLGDRFPRLGPADDGTRRDGQDIGQPVEFVLGVPAGVGQVIEHGRERRRRHGRPPDAIGVASKPYAVRGS